MSTFHKLLVANRGEIARRVIRTAHAMGLATVAVYSDADADLPFVAEADEAVRIGPGPSADSYLDPARILEAARRTGAGAIHPGYGFLSENAAFAEAVGQAGLVWVGPSAASMAALGDKATARSRAQALGVPVVPGYDGEAQDDDTLLAEARRIGTPLLVKASAGGGGRGMRRVDDLAQLPEALASARREARSGFADDRLLLERYVTRPRHLEVQVLGDTHGRVVHLGERECSIQRRHQKIVEEAPSPRVDAALREALGEAAVTLARSVDYVGAGTVEFILGDDGAWYFLEMNTRLQVEHPVTEEVTGVDLVRWQLEVALGAALPEQAVFDEALGQGRSAIEVRLYAEDPMRDWLPQAGDLVRVDLGGDAPGVRIEAGYGAGDTVPPHYDSMIAKVIATGADRAEAVRRLRRALDGAWVPGLVTNLPLLRDVVATPAFVAGDLHTGFLGEHGLPRTPPLHPTEGLALGALLCAFHDQEATARGATHLPRGWRLDGPAWVEDALVMAGQTHTVAVRQEGETFAVRLPAGLDPDGPTAGEEDDGSVQGPILRGRVLGRDGDVHHVVLDGLRRAVRLARASGDQDGPVADDDVLYLHLGGGREAMLHRAPRFPAPAALQDDPGSCVATTPGVVRAVHVAEGDAVAPGDPLVTLEAMKMEHVLTAPAAGTVASVRCDEGEAVEQGTLLVVVQTDDEA